MSEPVLVRVTMTVSVDVVAIRREEGMKGGSQALALEWVEGEVGAPIDNHILIESIDQVELAKS